MIKIGYTALYRKYRPQVFEEIIGQENITMTLKNQVKLKKYGHAYLFNGPRGTGKTSAAKILARAVNCENPVDGDPCNECDTCKGILEGSIMDVIEIDAASNNSVDNIRDIRDEIIYTPAKAQKKVYIIDEVHMLSQGAFNALLKTLEEPPEHAMFILATTEPHKLLPTIVSRCQKFDFKKISSKNICEGLNKVCAEAGINIEEEALKFIAQISDGGMRDALSILEQCASTQQELVTYDKVLAMVGMADESVLFDLAEAISVKDVPKAITIINKVYDDGKDINNFILKLVNFYRDALMVKIIDNSQNIVEMSSKKIEKLKDIVNVYTSGEIISIIDILSDTYVEAKRTGFSKIFLETTIIKLCRQLNSEDITDLKERLSRLEDKISNGIVVQNKDEARVKEGQKTKETKDTVKKEKADTVHEIKNKDFLNIINNWQEILDDLKAKGIIPLKIQFLSQVKIMQASEDTILLTVESAQDIHVKMLDDKSLIFELKDSILKITGMNIDIKVQSKKADEQEDKDEASSGIYDFMKRAEENGLGELIREV